MLIIAMYPLCLISKGKWKRKYNHGVFPSQRFHFKKPEFVTKEDYSNEIC
jgi:hypothetical protein